MKILKWVDIKGFPQLKKMSEAAWEARDNARLTKSGKTKVGAVVANNFNVNDGEMLFTGCNIEHRFRSHDIHAEVSAISSLVSFGLDKFDTILIVAEREKFTPCGSCMDWVMEVGGEKAQVMIQKSKNGDIEVYDAKELMPYYPY